MPGGGTPCINAHNMLALEHAGRPPPPEVADQVARACRTDGFFQLINHGLPFEVLEELQREMRLFFALPKPAKLVVARSKDNPMGYFDSELTKQARDLLWFRRSGSSHPAAGAARQPACAALAAGLLPKLYLHPT